MAESMKGLKRTHRCAELSAANVGEKVTIMGWVQKNRNKGGLVYSVNLLNNGQPAVMGMVQQIAGSNATQIATDVKKELEELSKNFPPGLKYTIEQDITEFLFASIEEVVFTLIITLLLVFVVVYIFLQDFRSTLIPMIAVPVALIGTFFFLWIFGFSINLLTLSALLLAIAIVVDDAIVVVEAVHAKLDQGYKSALTASIDAMNEISSAIISITLVMSAVFVPVSFIGGTSGYFYREFGVTMAVSIIISAVNALTLSPALCAIFLKPHEEGHEKKMSIIDRFHTGFNYQFEKITNKYKKGVQWVIGHGVIAGGVVATGIIALVALMGVTKTGLVPNEDTGTLFACISTAPGTTQQRTTEVVKQIDKMLEANPAIQRREAIMGYSFIGGAGSNQGTIIIKLKPFEERPGGFFHRIKSALTGGGIEALFVNPMEYTSVLGMIYKQTATIKDAQILAFSPPMISGFSAQSGITMTMQDKTGGDLNRFFDIVKNFLKELNDRPEIQTAQTQYNPNYPQYMVDVDVAKTKQAGISPSSVLAVMQGYLGGLYASNFNSYGKLYRVMIQAGPESRMRPDDMSKIYVRCANGTMSPVSEFVNLKKVYGPSNITRFNLFTSMDVSVTPNTGYSSGDGMKAIAEVAKTTLPEGYSYEYSGLTRSEAESSNSTGLIFALCIVFVYLILSAQYESYILPLSVVLSIPFGLAGAFTFTNIFGHANDIYMQISLIMLIGLLAKNAILIVQFALERRRTGMAIKYSAILGAGARLRPILMTSLAMIIGLLPLMFASGVGKNGNTLFNRRIAFAFPFCRVRKLAADIVKECSLDDRQAAELTRNLPKYLLNKTYGESKIEEKYGKKTLDIIKGFRILADPTTYYQDKKLTEIYKADVWSKLKVSTKKMFVNPDASLKNYPERLYGFLGKYFEYLSLSKYILFHSAPYYPLYGKERTLPEHYRKLVHEFKNNCRKDEDEYKEEMFRDMKWATIKEMRPSLKNDILRSFTPQSAIDYLLADQALNKHHYTSLLQDLYSHYLPLIQSVLQWLLRLPLSTLMRHCIR